MNLQLSQLFQRIDQLQRNYGSSDLQAIYGAGCINEPEIFFVFMNPTGKNVSANPSWEGLRAPWLGTKNVWRMLNKLKIVDDDLANDILNKKPEDWDYSFSRSIYEHLCDKKVYLTNLAKCTQDDARHLGNNVFKLYLDLIYEEVELTKPKAIITFGNQVSSILLNRNIKVSDYLNNFEELNIENTNYKVYPTYYPVGRGIRNIDKAISRINSIMDNGF